MGEPVKMEQVTWGRDRWESESLANPGVTEARSWRALSSEQDGKAEAAEGGEVPGGVEAGLAGVWLVPWGC